MPALTADGPAGEQRRGVEERERGVDDVVVGQLGDGGDVGAGAGDAALGAAHRLGQAGRAGGEDEQEEVVVRGRSRGRRDGAAAVERGLVAGVVDDQDPFGRDGVRRVVEQAGEVARGHQGLAVGVVDELGQLLAAVGRVDPDHDRARQRAGDEPEQVVGHVVEQDADVRRPLRVADLGERTPPDASPPRPARGSVHVRSSYFRAGASSSLRSARSCPKVVTTGSPTSTSM